jgi:hypothetical protein
MKKVLDLYSVPDVIRPVKSRLIRVMWPVDIPIMGDIRNCYNISVAKPERKRKLGRSENRWRSSGDLL